MSEQDEYGDLPVSPDFIEKLNVISDEEAENRALALRTGLEEFDSLDEESNLRGGGVVRIDNLPLGR